MERRFFSESYAALVYKRVKDGTGTRMFRFRLRTEINLSLSKETVVFQAQTVAIHNCVREILRLETVEPIAIFTDNQAVIYNSA